MSIEPFLKLSSSKEKRPSTNICIFIHIPDGELILVEMDLAGYITAEYYAVPVWSLLCADVGTIGVRQRRMCIDYRHVHPLVRSTGTLLLVVMYQYACDVRIPFTSSSPAMQAQYCRYGCSARRVTTPQLRNRHWYRKPPRSACN